MRTLLGLIITLAASGTAWANTGEDAVARICYIPFGVETYVRMTVTNINSHCSHIGDLDTNNKEYLNIQSIIAQAAVGRFEDGFVRVSIVVHNSESIYVDNFGGVKIGTAQFRLNASSLLRLRQILESVTLKLKGPMELNGSGSN